MINGPLVSVIIPIYNSEYYIRNTIASVIEQTYKNLEIIVVNDGSTDRSKDVIFSIMDQRTRYFEIINSGGPAKPRNYGLRVSKGKYIAFLDSDDIWINNKIEKQISMMEANPEIGLCYSLYKTFTTNNGKGEVFPKANNKIKGKGNDTISRILLQSEIPNSGVIIRKTVIDAVGEFDEHKLLFALEDTDLWSRIAHEAYVDYVDEILVLYRLHDKNISKHQIMVKIKKARYLLRKHYSSLGPFNYYYGLIRSMLYFIKNEFLSWVKNVFE